MQTIKHLLGEREILDKVVKYYVVQKDYYYGIELEEHRENQIVCNKEYFTPDFKEAYSLGTKMKIGSVSLISMHEIIDDYIQ